jgi:hypothetical protein
MIIGVGSDSNNTRLYRRFRILLPAILRLHMSLGLPAVFRINVDSDSYYSEPSRINDSVDSTKGIEKNCIRSDSCEPNTSLGHFDRKCSRMMRTLTAIVERKECLI